MSQRSSSFPVGLLPRFPGLRLEQAQLCNQTLTLSLRTEQPHARCPRCANPSSAIHGRYTRTPTDVPWGGYVVRCILHVRTFVCQTSACPQRICVERLPGVVEPLARMTVPLQEVLRLIAFAVGGEAGARLSERLGTVTSPATLIRMMRRCPPTTHPTPRVLSVDDWVRPVPSKQAAA